MIQNPTSQSHSAQQHKTFAVPLLKNLTEHYLSIYLYETAKFYAERLYYEQPSEANLNTFAHTFYRQGKMKQTYLMLRNSSSPENRYLLGSIIFDFPYLLALAST